MGSVIELNLFFTKIGTLCFSVLWQSRGDHYFRSYCNDPLAMYSDGTSLTFNASLQYLVGQQVEVQGLLAADGDPSAGFCSSEFRLSNNSQNPYEVRDRCDSNTELDPTPTLGFNLRVLAVSSAVSTSGT